MSSIRYGHRSRLPFAFRSILALAALSSFAAIESNSAEAAASPYAPSITFSVKPTTVSSGGKVTVFWKTTGATTCNASGGWQGSVSTGGLRSIGPLTNTTVFGLTCTGPEGSASQSATITVTGGTAPPAPTVKITSNPGTVASGSISTLTWSSTNATACSAAGSWSGAKAASGSQSTGALKANASYSLTCTGSGGSATGSAAVLVTSTIAAPTVSFSATPSSISTGNASTLSWSAANATACTASGSWSGSKATSGTQSTGALAANASYVLTCTGSGGSASQTAAVTVTAATTTLGAKYPGDIGIGADPAVIWNESFNEGSVSAVAARYSTVLNTGGMTLVADIPAHNAATTKSISMVSGGANDTTYLFRNFPKGYDELYVRYYAKYVTKGPWHHVGMVFGGYNPALSYPYPKAGQKPAGNDSFHIFYEPNSGGPYNNWTDFFNYYMQMHSFVANPVEGDYFGDQFVNNPALTTYDSNWHSYEIHLKLNTDMNSSTGAILELWIDDQPIIRYDDAGVIAGGGSEEAGGFWAKDKFCYLSDPSSICAPYNPGSGYIKLNQQYRSTESLKTNFMWLTNYNDYATNNEVRYSNVVFATQRIGAIVP
jgi:hypothetical protein